MTPPTITRWYSPADVTGPASTAGALHYEITADCGRLAMMALNNGAGRLNLGVVLSPRLFSWWACRQTPPGSLEWRGAPPAANVYIERGAPAGVLRYAIRLDADVDSRHARYSGAL